jgi:hypothetical protein
LIVRTSTAMAAIYSAAVRSWGRRRISCCGSATSKAGSSADAAAARAEGGRSCHSLESCGCESFDRANVYSDGRNLLRGVFLRRRSWGRRRISCCGSATSKAGSSADAAAARAEGGRKSCGCESFDRANVYSDGRNLLRGVFLRRRRAGRNSLRTPSLQRERARPGLRWPVGSLAIGYSSFGSSCIPTPSCHSLESCGCESFDRANVYSDGRNLLRGVFLNLLHFARHRFNANALAPAYVGPLARLR